MSGLAASVVMCDPGEQVDQAGLQWTHWLAAPTEKIFLLAFDACLHDGVQRVICLLSYKTNKTYWQIVANSFVSSLHFTVQIPRYRVELHIEAVKTH